MEKDEFTAFTVKEEREGKYLFKLLFQVKLDGWNFSVVADVHEHVDREGTVDKVAGSTYIPAYRGWTKSTMSSIVEKAPKYSSKIDEDIRFVAESKWAPPYPTKAASSATAASSASSADGK